MQKKTLVERVMAFLQGGDNAKLARFEGKVGKYFDKQIQMRKESIESLREKISDANDALGDAVLGVDVTNIGTTEKTDSYVASYVSNVSSKVVSIETFERQIEAINAEIAHFEKVKAAIYPEPVEA